MDSNLNPNPLWNHLCGLGAHLHALAVPQYRKNFTGKPRKVDPFDLCKLQRIEQCFWKAWGECKAERVRQYFYGCNSLNKTYAVRAIAWSTHARFCSPTQKLGTTQPTAPANLAQICCLQHNGSQLPAATGVIANLELVGAITWDKDLRGFLLTDELLSLLMGRPKVLSIKEAMRRDVWLWQLAWYDASDCWQMNADGLRGTALRRYQEFKRLVCTGEMTMCELEIAIARRNNPDLITPGQKLLFSEQEPSRAGYRRAGVADKDTVVPDQCRASTKAA